MWPVKRLERPVFCPRGARLFELGLICLYFAPTGALAQTLVDLTIEGLATVVEDSYADYTATARFDDGRELQVTPCCAWSLDAQTYAAIDQLGRLTTTEVSEDQAVVVSASFTWDDVTLEDSLAVTIIDVPDDPSGDPWPFWGRTTTRLGRTATVGPQTPTIDWSVQVNMYWAEQILEASPVVDAAGRIFVGTSNGISAVDSLTREVVWYTTDGDVTRGAAVWGECVVWGDFSPFSTLYCYDAATGAEVWRFETGGAMTAAPVIDVNGVIYIIDQGTGLVHARRIEDHSEVWTTWAGPFPMNTPSLKWALLLTSAGGPTAYDLVGLDPLTGGEQWTFETDREIYGMAAMFAGRVYVASTDRYLYCLDEETGQEIWRFWCEQINQGSVSIGHDGTIYTATSGNKGILFAVSPDGDQLWRLELPGLVSNAPIVGGDGTVYVCSHHWTGSDYEGRVHAIRPDGTQLWEKLMPDDVRASPMLAPDGTLYVVCRDKYLYAFKDPPQPPTPEPVELSDPTDAVPVSP